MAFGAREMLQDGLLFGEKKKSQVGGQVFALSAWRSLVQEFQLHGQETLSAAMTRTEVRRRFRYVDFEN